MDLSNALFELDVLWNLLPVNFYQIIRGDGRVLGLNSIQLIILITLPRDTY